MYVFRDSSSSQVKLYKRDTEQTIAGAICASAQSTCSLTSPGTLETGGAPSATVHTDGNLWVSAVCSSDSRVHARAWSTADCTPNPFTPLGGGDPILNACDANGSLPGGGTNCPTGSPCSCTTCTTSCSTSSCIVDLNCNRDPDADGQPIIASSNDASAQWLYVSLWDDAEFDPDLYVQRFKPGTTTGNVGTVDCESADNDGDGGFRSRIQILDWINTTTTTSATVAKWSNYLYYVYADSAGNVKRMRRELE